MPGLDPGILAAANMDRRVKPGEDDAVGRNFDLKGETPCSI